MADPTTLPPQFVGRYPGAPIPLPVPVEPSHFVSRQATGAPGTTSGAMPVYTRAPWVAPVAAVPAAPAPGVVTPANAASVPAAPTVGLAISPTPAPTQQALDFVKGLPTLAQPAAQPPLLDANGNEQVNLPPLPANMAAGGGGAVGLPSDAGPNTDATAAVASQGDENTWRPAQTVQGSTYQIGGAGSDTAAAITGGHLLDPVAAIQRGYDQQQAYQASALQALMNLARQGGSPLNASFRFAHLAPAFAAAIGNNNFGGVQAQGVDALNSSIAGLSSAGIGADTQRYVQGQENIRQQALLGQREAEYQRTPLPTGQGIDFSAGYAVPTTTYAQPGAKPGGMVSVGPQADRQEKAKPVVGKTYVDKDGNRAVYQADGTYKPEGR